MRTDGRSQLPLPATQERGEGRGEGLLGCRGTERRRVWWDEPVVRDLPHDLHTAGAPVKGAPDFQQHAFPVAPPLVIPKTQFLDVVGGDVCLACAVVPPLFRQPVLETVHFQGQAGRWTIEVEVISSERVLAAELETGKAAGPQRTPQVPLFVGLFPAKTARVADGIHRRKDRRTGPSGKPLSLSLSPRGGEREFPHGRAWRLRTHEFQSKVRVTGSQIDRSVHNLYGLTADEIKLVEGATR